MGTETLDPCPPLYPSCILVAGLEISDQFCKHLYQLRVSNSKKKSYQEWMATPGQKYLYLVEQLLYSKTNG